MKWLTNLDDPRHGGAHLHILHEIGRTRAEAWQAQERWLADKILGDPQATDYYSVEQLKQMGMVGVYTNETGVTS